MKKDVMNRLKFIASLLGFGGLAGAQQWKERVPEVHAGEYHDVIRNGRFKPALNNQCPVCGEMAEPYKRPLGGMQSVPCDPPVKYPSNIGCAAPAGPYGPTEILVRCKRCSAAFWKDSEN